MSSNNPSSFQITPTIRVSTLNLWLILSLVFVVSVALVQWMVIPALRGDDVLPFFVGDSFSYVERARSMTADELKDFTTARSMANLFGMAIVGQFALWVSETHSEYVIFSINFLLLFIMLRYCQKVFQYYEVPNRFSLFLLLLFLNPMVCVSLLSLNKEIWGLFFLTGFLWYRISGAWIRYFLLTCVALCIRNVYAFAALLFVGITTLRFSWFWYLLGFSFLAPFSGEYGLDILYGSQDERSTGLTMVLTRVQQYPLGYLVTFWPRLLLNLFEGISPTRLFQFVLGFPLMIKLSSMFFFSVSAVIVRRRLLFDRRCNSLVLQAAFVYTLVACLTPFIHHRYFFPLFPYLLMALLLPMASKSPSYEAS